MAAAGGVIEGGVVAGPVHEMQEWLRSLGAKRVFLAPLVGGSDLAFRTMCYERGVVAAFSPMLYARHAVENPNYLNLNLDTQPAENVIVQFCANNGDFFARAIDKVRLRCRGVDLNLSWTSKRAERGGYGEYLLKNPTQLESVVRAGVATQVPITCKLRLQASVAETIATAQRLEAWGVSLLTIEGRTSAQLDSRRGIANWEDIAQIRAAVGIPILYNGDLVVREQIEACLAYTGVDGVVVGEGLLYNPCMLKAEAPEDVIQLSREYIDRFRSTGDALPGTAREHLQYFLHMAIVRYPRLAEELALANAPRQLTLVLDALDARLAEDFENTAILPALRACQPSFRRFATADEGSRKRFEGDVDCTSVAAAWRADLEAQGVVPSDFDALDAQRCALLSDVSIGTRKRMDRIAKKRARHAAKKEARKEGLPASPAPPVPVETHASSGLAGQGAAPTTKRAKRNAKLEQRARLAQALGDDDKALRVAVDLSLHEAMSLKEINKLVDQIRRFYGRNLRAQHPARVHLTSFQEDSPIVRALWRQTDGLDNMILTKEPKAYHECFAPEQIVYLTPDAPEPLLEVDPQKVYVMGGLVDESIIKNYTLDRATARSITTARLPIEELCIREKGYAPVLSINQVLGALLTVCDTDDWHAALEEAIPARKGFVVRPSEEVAIIVSQLRAERLAGVTAQAQGGPTVDEELQ